PQRLGLEQRVAPARASWAAARRAAWLGEGATTVAYPGLWLREDVYATHGHLLDLFSTIPTFERIGAAITSRVVGGDLPDEATVDDFLARLEPVYAWVDAMARHTPAGRAARGAPPAGRARAPTGRASRCASSTTPRRCSSDCSPTSAPTSSRRDDPGRRGPWALAGRCRGPRTRAVAKRRA